MNVPTLILYVHTYITLHATQRLRLRLRLRLSRFQKHSGRAKKQLPPTRDVSTPGRQWLIPDHLEFRSSTYQALANARPAP
jgi:hypothetical protein